MALCLRAPVTIADDPDSIASTQNIANNSMELLSQRVYYSLLAYTHK